MKPSDFPMQNTLSYPSFFPTPPDLPMDQSTSDDPVAKRQRLSWYFYLSEISLRRLATRIQQEVSQVETQPGRNTLETLAELEPGWQKQAQDWLENLPPELSLYCANENDDICRFVLRGHLLNIYELIYWPFVMAVLNLGESEVTVSPIAVQLANKGLAMHQERLVVNQPGFYHRHHGTMGMTAALNRFWQYDEPTFGHWANILEVCSSEIV
ncbi:hypothetical protein D6C87_09986 [Aureobasidium pullulans]|nr:hypothetical protein D6C87_09986 [Aureobasidium pullulans]